MRIGLAAYRCENGNIEFNLSQIEKALGAARGRVDLIVFGESFVQGFDSLSWNYEIDIEAALTHSSPVFGRLRELSSEYGTAIAVGYFERGGENIYSSCAVISEGEIVANHRRVSPGWKITDFFDPRYREGKDARGFDLCGRHFSLALCGDLWDCPELFKTEGTLIWPVFLSYGLEDWKDWALEEYAEHAAGLSGEALIVNPIDPETDTHGGAFLMRGGVIEKALPFDEEGVLIVELEG